MDRIQQNCFVRYAQYYTVTCRTININTLHLFLACIGFLHVLFFLHILVSNVLAIHYYQFFILIDIYIPHIINISCAFVDSTL